MNENTRNDALLQGCGTEPNDNFLVRLEYHEKTGSFHFETDFNKMENVVGWKTVERRTGLDEAMKFVQSVDEFLRRFMDVDYKPTFDEVRDYWAIFFTANLAGQSDNEK